MTANSPRNVIVTQPHPRSKDSQGQETFLALLFWLFQTCLSFPVFSHKKTINSVHGIV